MKKNLGKYAGRTTIPKLFAMWGYINRLCQSSASPSKKLLIRCITRYLKGRPANHGKFCIPPGWPDVFHQQKFARKSSWKNWSSSPSMTAPSSSPNSFPPTVVTQCPWDFWEVGININLWDSWMGIWEGGPTWISRDGCLALLVDQWLVK